MVFDFHCFVEFGDCESCGSKLVPLYVHPQCSECAWCLNCCDERIERESFYDRIEVDGLLDAIRDGGKVE